MAEPWKLPLPDTAQRIDVGSRRFGHIWPSQLGWAGRKSGEFRTQRDGFMSRDSASAWVLTNTRPALLGIS